MKEITSLGDGRFKIEGVFSERQLLSFVTGLIKRKFCRDVMIHNSNKAKEFLSLTLSLEEREIFGCIFLNNKHKVIAFERLFFGTIDSAVVYPREILKRALSHNAAALILVHNHPSGSTDPSQQDKDLTISLKNSLSVFDIRVIDHIVVGGGDATSFTELGLI